MYRWTSQKERLLFLREFQDPVTTVCEVCEGKRYSQEAMSYQYKGKNIVEILDMSAGEAYEFFNENRKLKKAFEYIRDYRYE